MVVQCQLVVNGSAIDPYIFIVTNMINDCNHVNILWIKKHEEENFPTQKYTKAMDFMSNKFLKLIKLIYLTTYYVIQDANIFPTQFINKSKVLYVMRDIVQPVQKTYRVQREN